MAKMGQRLNFIRKLFRKKEEVIVGDTVSTNLPIFDSRYKHILKVSPNNYSYEMLYWLNENSSGKIDVRRITDKAEFIYFGFEDESDALIFKIKYL